MTNAPTKRTQAKPSPSRRCESVAESLLKTHTWSAGRDRLRAEHLGGRSRPKQHDEAMIESASPRQTPKSPSGSSRAILRQVNGHYSHGSTSGATGGVVQNHGYLDVENRGSISSAKPLASNSSPQPLGASHAPASANGPLNAAASEQTVAVSRPAASHASNKTQANGASPAVTSPAPRNKYAEMLLAGNADDDDQHSPGKLPANIVNNYSHAPRMYSGSFKIPNGHYHPSSPQKQVASSPMEVPNTYSPRTDSISPRKDAYLSYTPSTPQQPANIFASPAKSARTPRTGGLGTEGEAPQQDPARSCASQHHHPGGVGVKGAWEYGVGAELKREGDASSLSSSSATSKEGSMVSSNTHTVGASRATHAHIALPTNGNSLHTSMSSNSNLSAEATFISPRTHSQYSPKPSLPPRASASAQHTPQHAPGTASSVTMLNNLLTAPESLHKMPLRPQFASKAMQKMAPKKTVLF